MSKLFPRIKNQEYLSFVKFEELGAATAFDHQRNLHTSLPVLFDYARAVYTYYVHHGMASIFQNANIDQMEHSSMLRKNSVCQYISHFFVL